MEVIFSLLLKNVSLGEGLKLRAGYSFSDRFSLSPATEMNDRMALSEKDGRDMMFTHHYIVTGLRPEIKFGKTGISMPVMIGISVLGTDSDSINEDTNKLSF